MKTVSFDVSQWVHVLRCLCLAKNSGMTARQIRVSKTLIEEHDDEIRNAWQTHFEC